MPLAASAISVRRRFLAARDVRVMHFHLPGQHDQQDHAGGTAAPDGTVAHFSPDDGGVLFHGTREPSAVYRPKEGQELYLTDDYGEASGYATGAHLGGRGRVPTVVKLEVRPGRTADVNDEVNELIVNGSPDDLQKLFAGYRERGYRYVTYEHPSFIHDDREQRVVVSLFPHEDVKSRGGWRVGGAKTSHARFFANPERVLRFAAPSRAASRCNFAAIKQREDALAKTAVPEAANAVARGVKRMLGDDAQLAALLDDDPQDIAALSMNGADVGRVRAAFDGALETAYETGRVTGANELSRAGRPLTFAALREKAAGYIAANGFRMAENVSEATRAVIQGELLTGVKSGKRPAAVREAIWNGLVAKGLTSREAALGVETDEAVVGALNELWVEDEPEAAYYLDTLVRTNSFEAMNEARYAEFTDPEVRGFVQALEYSAILDSNTTPICEHLDGRVYRADNEEVWNKFRPPNHYNCRSVLIPVTAIDGWDGAESEEPEIDPQVGFFTRRPPNGKAPEDKQ